MALDSGQQMKVDDWRDNGYSMAITPAEPESTVEIDPATMEGDKLLNTEIGARVDGVSIGLQQNAQAPDPQIQQMKVPMAPQMKDDALGFSAVGNTIDDARQTLAQQFDGQTMQAPAWQPPQPNNGLFS